MGFTIKGEEAGKSSSVGKGPSEAPAIDQKIMSDQSSMPSVSFHVLEKLQGGLGGDTEEWHGGGEDIRDSHLFQTQSQLT